jgi:hypothetical protein
MVRGGYSASSARKPAEILGGTSRDLARRVIQEQPDSLSALRPLSLRTLREIISDDGVSAQTRANAAGGVLRLAAELGEDEQAGEITDEDRIAAHVYRLRLLRLGMLLCARYGFAVALERLDKAAHARLGMSLQDARMRQPRAAAAPSRRVHRVGSE